MIFSLLQELRRNLLLLCEFIFLNFHRPKSKFPHPPRPCGCEGGARLRRRRSARTVCSATFATVARIRY